jgi:hypothetical protein
MGDDDGLTGGLEIPEKVLRSAVATCCCGQNAHPDSVVQSVEVEVSLAYRIQVSDCVV